MPMMRIPSVTTTTTAPGSVGGELTVTATAGMTRNAVLAISHATGGWEVKILRVLSATKVLARYADDGVTRLNRQDLSGIPAGASVTLGEQWVEDLWSDDAPDALSIPTK